MKIIWKKVKIAIDFCRYLVYTTSITIKQSSRKEHNMTRNEAKLELFKVNRNIEKMIVAHANELGQHNKNCVMNDLQRMWDKKKTLQNIINS